MGLSLDLSVKTSVLRHNSDICWSLLKGSYICDHIFCGAERYKWEIFFEAYLAIIIFD